VKITNLRIGARLGLAFGVVISLTLISNLLSWSALDAVQSDWSEFSSVSMQKRELTTTSKVKLGDAIHHFKNYLIRGGDYDKKFLVDLADIRDAMATYAKTGPQTSQEKGLLGDIAKDLDGYGAALPKVVAMKASGASIEEIDKRVSGADKAIGQALDGLMQVAREDTLAAGQAITGSAEQGKTLVIALALAVAAVSAICSWLVTRSITLPINRAVKIAQTVAAGDLSSRIEVHSTDEAGQLLLALRDMNGSLLRIVAQVRSGTDAIATASNQIASGNLDLSARTEQQASTLEETASSMDELTSTVKQNAENAHQADGLASAAAEVASKGGLVVQQVVQTMGSINQSSRKIADIISVIDSIAFQTNILALNAAVEAARAGEQGRGFAVVASEVRNLAQRSAGAAKEIKILITDSVEQVDVGTRLVDQAGATMNEVVASVQRVSEVIGQITLASQEQAAGIEQVNQAVMQMDTVTQENAALVEEAAAASESMQDQAEQLAEVVSIFTLASTAAPVIMTRHAAGAAAPARLALSGKPALSPRRRAA
jgi:methyl-accepting chemotaxis protein